MRAYKANGHDVHEDVREALALLENDDEIAVDLETSGLRQHADKIAVVTMYGEQTSTLAILHTRGTVPLELKAFLSRKDKRFTYHNGVCFDIPFLLNYGIKATLPRLYDTIVGAGVVTTVDRAGESKSLQAEISKRLGVYISKEITRDEARKAAAGKPVKRKKKDEGAEKHGSWMDPHLTDGQLQYCSEDILHMHALRRAQEEKIVQQRQQRAIDLEMAIVSSVATMTHNGLPLHVASLDAYRERRRKFVLIESAILSASFGDLNVNSAAQVKEVMRSLDMKIPIHTEYKFDPSIGKRVKVEKESTRADLLDAIALRGVPGIISDGLLPKKTSETDEQYTKRAEFVAATMNRIVRLREAIKAVDFYDDYWLNRFRSERGRVHASFRQSGTATLRFSAANPNLQQWPKDMRSVIGGEEGMQIVAADFSQIEVVIAAELAGDGVLLDLIAQGGDTHSMVAAYCLNKNPSAVTVKERRAFKSGNFCLIFGGTPETLREYALAKGAVNLSLEEATQIHDIYFEKFAGLRKMKEQAQALAKDQSRKIVEIRLRTGGVRHLIRADGSLKSTTILNTQVQGNAAGGMKYAILECKKAGLDMFLGASIHDELVAVVPTRHAQEYGEELQACMVRGMAQVLNTPARTELTIGGFWS